MAPKKDGTPKEYLDFLGTFQGGVNDYPPALLLDKTSLSSAVNTTVRNDYVSQRPCFKKVFLDSASQTILNNAILLGPYQGGTYFKPDPGLGYNNGAEGIAVSIASVLASIFPDPNDGTAKVVTIPITYNAAANAPSIQQVWMWQSEMFVILQDGTDNPLFYNVNLGTASQSLWGVPQIAQPHVLTAFVAPAVGTLITGVNVSATANMTAGNNTTGGTILYFTNFGNMQVANVVDATHVDLVNINVKAGKTIPVNGGISFSYVSSAQLPPGRMGAYGLGRNWFSLTDGRQFVASDLVGGSSGTATLNWRDSVLNITENAFLAGGGNFIVPGAIGSIQAMIFMATLDTSLGQGPLQVLTHTNSFSCQTPVDRLTWQDLNNPILTESLKGFGATGQYSTINVNTDILMRSIAGIQSFIQARRDFDVWGNVPISTEISGFLDKDNQTILNYGSAIVFDNRFIMTMDPVQITQGTIHKKLAALNLDPISSLRGKQPSVYDAEYWSGLNVFQLFVGSFANRERAFALCYNTQSGDVELYEILTSENIAYQDDLGGNIQRRIVWNFSSPSLFKDTIREYKKLWNGEIYVDELEGQVDFQVWFRPDQWPCWIPWLAWTECQTQPSPGSVSPGYRPRMGLGIPPATFFDPESNRPLNTGYTFQILTIVTGKCRVIGGKFKAVEEPEPEFAPPRFVQECPPTPL